MHDRPDRPSKPRIVAGVIRAARLDAEARVRDGALAARSHRARRRLEEERLGDPWERRLRAAPPSPTPYRHDDAALTWIGIELVREDGTPVAGERYRVEMEDGSVRTGRLDSSGRAELRGVPPGTCLVRFPCLPEAGVRALSAG